jgi:hypothetical protein
MARTKKAEPDFSHFVQAAIELVEEFRDELAVETSKMMIERRDHPEAFDAERHKNLHQMRLASDGFCQH